MFLACVAQQSGEMQDGIDLGILAKLQKLVDVVDVDGRHSHGGAVRHRIDDGIEQCPIAHIGNLDRVSATE
jgi:hypothetical protein